MKFKKNDGEGEIDFNEAHAKRVKESQFLEDHDHHKDEVDLKAVYKALREKPPKPTTPAPAEETAKV